MAMSPEQFAPLGEPWPRATQRAANWLPTEAEPLPTKETIDLAADLEMFQLTTVADMVRAGQAERYYSRGEIEATKQMFVTYETDEFGGVLVKVKDMGS